MNNDEIARLLRWVAAAYEIQGESLFRIRAYENAADSCEHATREVKDLWDEDRLGSLPGIGTNIASHLDELFRTGSVSHFKEVFSRYPPAMFVLLEIPGIGPKTAHKLTTSLGITSQKDATRRIKRAAEEGKIRDLAGFGKTSEKAILDGIKELERREHRMLLPQATALAEEVMDYMKNEVSVVRIEPLGSLRRRAATVGDIDLAVATDHPGKVIDHFTHFGVAKKILAAGVNTARLIHRGGQQVDLKTQTPVRFGSLLQHFTGSKAHNIHLREIALQKGFSLSENGIKFKGKTRAYATEEAFYAALGMQWIPPETREDSGEIEAALAHALPELVTFDEIRGDLHLHTDYGWRSSHDAGTAPAKVMIEKAISMGYEYVGVGDHNPSTGYYSISQLVHQVQRRSKLLTRLKRKFTTTNKRIHVLNSLEVDILPDGSLALPDEALELLDYAVVSVHSSLRLTSGRMTQRLIRGLSHPKAKILGHPTGRMLNKREGYEADWEKVFHFIKEHKKMVEINSWPSRLDCPDALVRTAKDSGVQLVINTDAHAPEHLELMRFGVDVARRGWCRQPDIVNTLPFERFNRILLRS